MGRQLHQVEIKLTLFPAGLKLNLKLRFFLDLHSALNKKLFKLKNAMKLIHTIHANKLKLPKNWVQDNLKLS